MVKRTFPCTEQLLDVASLRVVERNLREQAARFGRIVVLDRRFEVLAQRRRLPELAPEPAEE